MDPLESHITRRTDIRSIPTDVFLLICDCLDFCSLTRLATTCKALERFLRQYTYLWALAYRPGLVNEALDDRVIWKWRLESVATVIKVCRQVYPELLDGCPGCPWVAPAVEAAERGNVRVLRILEAEQVNLAGGPESWHYSFFYRSRELDLHHADNCPLNDRGK